MNFQKLCSLLFLSAVVLTGAAMAQQPSKIKRPVKNPPQFPSIIDLENKDATNRQTEQQPVQQNKADDSSGQAPASLATAVQSLANEMKTLGQELRSLNIRGQAQIEMMRMARVDMRIDQYERDLRPLRERLASLESDEQILQQAMTREALLAQTATTPTLNREESMRQLRMQHEFRYRATQTEKDKLKKLEADLTQSLKIYQNMSREAEQKLQDAEDTLKSIESRKPEATSGSNRTKQN